MKLFNMLLKPVIFKSLQYSKHNKSIYTFFYSNFYIYIIFLSILGGNWILWSSDWNNVRYYGQTKIITYFHFITLLGMQYKIKVSDCGKTHAIENGFDQIYLRHGKINNIKPRDITANLNANNKFSKFNIYENNWLKVSLFKSTTLHRNRSYIRCNTWRLYVTQQ